MTNNPSLAEQGDCPARQASASLVSEERKTADATEAAPLEPGAGTADDLRGNVIRVLQQFTRESDERGWVIAPLNEGAQASIFAVRRQDGRPLWQSRLELAIKLYKSPDRQNVEVVRGQFQALAQLHSKLGDSCVDGWQIHVPAPLYQCERPLALVMTLVPGRSLNSCLETPGRVRPETLEPIAGAVIAAMERYWAIDSQIHGDLNFDNILCDEASRGLSFVDPGVIEQDFLCEGVSRHWYPASRDLAYMLYDTGVAVKRMFGNPGARRLQQGLVESVLRAFMKKIGTVREKLCLLDEIRACVRVHLKRLRFSWSRSGIWHLLLRRIASRRIDAILGRLRPAVGPGNGSTWCAKGGARK